MTIRTFFHIVIRIIGLLLLKDGIVIFFSPLQTLLAFGSTWKIADFWPLVASLVISAAYFGLCAFCFVRSGQIIDWLGLHKNYDTDTLEFQFDPRTVLLASVTIIGGWMVASEIPELFTAIFKSFQMQQYYDRFNQTNPFAPQIIKGGLRVLTGLVIVGYRNQLSNWWLVAESRRDKNLEV